MRLHEILKLTSVGWVHVEYMKAKTITIVEKKLDGLKNKHSDAVGWKIVPYKQVEHGARTYQSRIF